MSDYISINEVLEKINELAREAFTLDDGYGHYFGALHDVANDLRKMPTIDAVPVVRCKDCRWHIDEEPEMVYCPHIVGGWVDENGYCSLGERKDDA